MALFRSDGSIHTRTDPFGFLTAIQFDIHAVGVSTFAMTPCFSSSPIFFSKSSLSAYATLRGRFCTGGISLSITMSYTPGRHPIQLNTSSYSLMRASTFFSACSSTKCTSSATAINCSCKQVSRDRSVAF